MAPLEHKRLNILAFRADMSHVFAEAHIHVYPKNGFFVAAQVQMANGSAPQVIRENNIDRELNRIADFT